MEPMRLVPALLAASVALTAADRDISFSKDVRPIFEKTCWNCHGPSVQLSQLSLAKSARPR